MCTSAVVRAVQKDKRLEVHVLELCAEMILYLAKGVRVVLEKKYIKLGKFW